MIEAALRENRADEKRGEALVELLQLYHKAGRFDDVLALLDEAPGWGVDDLGRTKASLDQFTSTLLAAADALAHKGRTDETRKLVDHLLETRPEFDPAYALLIRIEGPDSIARLDVLFTRDRFEERPLIWKAQLQLEAGQLEAAEKSVRAAIAIDPSDGEQPKGDRLRAYSVLAEILSKKGDSAQAKIFRRAVEAIRRSEVADEWYHAGLHTRAAQRYEEALTFFADAYCIQSRLALRYAEAAEFAKATAHYLRAYELMPDSFGRVESHCFGCEKVFSDDKAQTIANKVFTSLAAQSPQKPQLHYLLGYLREQEGRPVEALKSYQRAVALDPDYLNASRRITGLREMIGIPVVAADAALLNQIRLDPLRRHGSATTRRIADLRGYWLSVETAGKQQPPLAESLCPLAASKAALQRTASARPGWDSNFTFRGEPFQTPGEAIAETAVFEAAASVLSHVSGD